MQKELSLLPLTIVYFKKAFALLYTALILCTVAPGSAVSEMMKVYFGCTNFGGRGVFTTWILRVNSVPDLEAPSFALTTIVYEESPTPSL
jgi:hypothetical protein